MKRSWALPLVPLYAAGLAWRSTCLRLGLERVRHLEWPVISVGSLSAGGAGKTPFVIALGRLLADAELHADVLSRGYGRSSREAHEVMLGGSPEAFGDEPLLIREAGLAVYVAARRWEAGRLAEAIANEAGRAAGVHLLDDGFQHRQLARNVDIVLVSSEDLEDWLLPAGNLRERTASLRRATVLAVPANDDQAVTQLRTKLGTKGLSQPVWRFRRVMSVPAVSGPVVAFCGIARPAQFFDGLEKAGVSIAARHAFADHHRFGMDDVALLRQLIRQTGAAALITTEKDRVRLGRVAAEFGAPVQVAELRVEIEDPGSSLDRLVRALEAPAG